VAVTIKMTSLMQLPNGIFQIFGDDSRYYLWGVQNIPDFFKDDNLITAWEDKA
jgi:hypothetical protein